MKIEITTRTNYDSLDIENMSIDGKDTLHVGPLCECPEDAIIGRDLVSCQDVAYYMKLAHEAGRRGEELEIVVRPE